MILSRVKRKEDVSLFAVYKSEMIAHMRAVKVSPPLSLNLLKKSKRRVALLVLRSLTQTLEVEVAVEELATTHNIQKIQGQLELPHQCTINHLLVLQMKKIFP